jgi:hypothetical protein
MGGFEDREFDEFADDIGGGIEGDSISDTSYNQKGSKKDYDSSLTNKKEQGIEKGKSEELIIEAKKFFDFSKKELGKSIKKGSNVIYLDLVLKRHFALLNLLLKKQDL